MFEDLFACAKTDSFYLPLRRRQVAGQGQITHTDSGIAKKNDLPEEDDEDDDPEDELDRY